MSNSPSVQGTSSTSYIQHSSPSDAGVRLMSADDIMAYVTQALGDVGGQLEVFRKKVEDRQAQAAVLRDTSALLRASRGNDGIGSMDQAQFGAVMTNLSKLAETNPLAKNVYDKILASYGGFVAGPGGAGGKAEGEIVGVMAGTANNDGQDMWLENVDCDGIMKNLEEAQSGLGSDNELIMMDLQQLMQRRNQITQFSSNCMNVMNEGMKAVIGNIR